MTCFSFLYKFFSTMSVSVMLLGFAGASLAQAAQEPSAPASYTVTWSNENFPEAHVNARLEIKDGKLSMFPGLAWTFDDKRAWARNILNLTARTPDGTELELTPLEGPEWTVGENYEGPAAISYSVDFSFATRDFSTGNEQIAWLKNKALFTTGFALFIYSQIDTPAEIHIEVPEGWEVATAWPQKENGTLLAKDQNHLIRNILTVGTGYHLETITRGDLTLDIALLGHHASAADLLRKTFSDIMDYYVDLFDFSESGHFMMALLPGPNDGEGYMTSFASSQPVAPTRDDSLVWANSLAHEFFHYWNGSRVSSVWDNYAERQWYSEGFTEYYANLALLNVGVIDVQRYDEILGQYLSYHMFFSSSGLYKEVTMREAGKKKGRNRPGVYDSGFATAFCLDGLIREATDRKRTLDDMMRLMEMRFGQTGRPIVFSDIVAAASETAGTDLAPFFAAHVEGRTPLPIAQCAAHMGYMANIDGYHVYLNRLP